MMDPNLLALLRWSTSQEGKDGTVPTKKSLSPEELENRQKKFAWLESVMKETMALHPSKQMEILLDVLRVSLDEMKQGNNDSTVHSEEAVEKKTKALEGLLDFVENIDLASDFVKLGGIDVLLPYVTCGCEPLAWRCSEILATSVQNHPKNEKQALEKGCLGIFVGVVNKKSSSAKETVKALLGVSSLVRGEDRVDGLGTFLGKYAGFDMLLSVCEGSEERFDLRCRRKATFLLRFVVEQIASKFARKKVAIRCLDVLPKLIGEESTDYSVREHTLAILTNLVPELLGNKKLKEKIDKLSESLSGGKYCALHGLEKSDSEAQAASALYCALQGLTSSSSSNNQQNNNNQGPVLLLK